LSSSSSPNQLTRKGWIRVLVSLSLIWMIGGTLYIASRFIDHATKLAEGLRWMCEQGNASLVRDYPKYAHLADCTSDWQKNYRIGLGGDYSYGDLLGWAAMFAFGGLVLAWLLGGGLVIIARWVHRGFLRSKHVGWLRLGIVASVAWAIGGGYWGNSIGISRGDWAVEALGTCLSQRSIQSDGTVPANTDWAPCNQAFDWNYRIAVADHWLYAAMFGIVPIVLGWLGLSMTWWIRKGFTVH
jgi:hypothetical protein